MNVTTALDALATVHDADIRLVRDRERSECCVIVPAADTTLAWGPSAEVALTLALQAEESRLCAEVAERTELLETVRRALG